MTDSGGVEAGQEARERRVERIDFGVVNYNGGEAVLRCVRSILDQQGPPCRVWVFDNDSEDGSAEAVERIEGEVRVIRSPVNVGYPRALNRLVATMEAEVVVLSNMDVAFEPGWAAAVAAAWEADPGAASVTTVVVEDTDPPVLNSLGVRFWGDLHAQNVGSGERVTADLVRRGRAAAFGGYGAVLCLRRSVARSVGFDEDYFLFFEETDFFLRFHLLGYRSTFSSDAVARHQRSLSTRRYSPLKLYYGERNRLTTVFKLLPVWYWPVTGVETLRRFALLARRAKRGPGAEVTPMPSTGRIVWTLLRAWLAAKARLPRTLHKRWRFWRIAPTRPIDALALVRRYGLSPEELRLR